MNLIRSSILTVGIFFTLISLAALTEQKKIEGLLSAIENSNTTFIRNGQNYTSKEAAKHLREKLASAEDSWFAPKKGEWTAMMFIEKVASKSSTSGKDYFIQLADGRQVKAYTWLVEKLRILESENK